MPSTSSVDAYARSLCRDVAAPLDSVRAHVCPHALALQPDGRVAEREVVQTELNRLFRLVEKRKLKIWGEWAYGEASSTRTLAETAQGVLDRMPAFGPWGRVPAVLGDRGACLCAHAAIV